MIIKFKLNGEEREENVEEDERALDFLRRIGMKSVKEGCGEGECGACTIIVNGKNVVSCLMLAPELDGTDVLTTEGLGKDKLDPVQEAFAEIGAVQCGFCTPGMEMSTKALLMKNPHPSEEDIKKGLEGNLCRCTGYFRIIEAVKKAAGKV
ncbi:(2Fe-2S)-binding protein [Athalassotoga saccharophila]|uniref:(2Fe-2S)-binding protein n=1 Tax=Athalassotoga saccharophila TaxID=1441386 RepID=UPI00137B3E2C|nr:(2Fe-2S)-binding protein [Athalassotoga saccharophila]BBJ28876.1 nicotinate dehydrogenase small FeS subunit [Athalassotoga saccharophila]